MKKLLALVLALAASFAPAACGGDDKSDEDQVRDVIELVNEQDKEACGKLSDRYLRTVIGGSEEDCEKQVKNTPRNAVKIDDVSVDGDKATVRADIQGTAGEVRFVKEDGDWKMDDIKRR